MASKGHLITGWLEISNFVDILEKYKDIKISEHAKMRLTNKQRGLDEDDIKQIILHKLPEKIGLQSNGLFALFYEQNKDDYVKIIVNISITKIFIVTFHNIDKQGLPRLK